jgi:hypothetical protein
VEASRDPVEQPDLIEIAIMATIDIALPDEITQALSPPVCADLQLPQVKVPTLDLPLPGLQIQGIADFTRGIPTECSMNFSLLAQLAPIMANFECLFKLLKFVGVAIQIIQGITSPMNIISAIPKIVEASKDVAECIAMVAVPPLGLLCFVKQVLELIASMLLCAVEALESILAIMSGLQIQIADAQAAGNEDLLQALNCAQENAGTAADGAMQSLQPIAVLLALAQPILGIAGHSVSVTIPSPVPSSDLQGMQTLLQTLGTVAETIKEIADAIPC